MLVSNLTPAPMGKEYNTLADFLSKMRIAPSATGAESIHIWRDENHKWFISAQIADSWIVISPSLSKEGVGAALSKLQDMASDFIEISRTEAVKTGRIIDFSDMSDNADDEDMEAGL